MARSRRRTPDGDVLVSGFVSGTCAVPSQPDATKQQERRAFLLVRWDIGESAGTPVNGPTPTHTPGVAGSNPAPATTSGQRPDQHGQGVSRCLGWAAGVRFCGFATGLATEPWHHPRT